MYRKPLSFWAPGSRPGAARGRTGAPRPARKPTKTYGKNIPDAPAAPGAPRKHENVLENVVVLSTREPPGRRERRISLQES